MQDKIDSLIADLSAFKDHLTELGDIKAAHNTSEADLKSVQDALASAKKELESSKAGLTTAQIANQKAHDEAIFAKHKELEDITARTTTAKATLDDLNAKINSATTRHKQIEDSLGSLKAKFA
jgi:chromosome segregation ATPase